MTRPRNVPARRLQRNHRAIHSLLLSLKRVQWSRLVQSPGSKQHDAASSEGDRPDPAGDTTAWYLQNATRSSLHEQNNPRAIAKFAGRSGGRVRRPGCFLFVDFRETGRVAARRSITFFAP